MQFVRNWIAAPRPSEQQICRIAKASGLVLGGLHPTQFVRNRIERPRSKSVPHATRRHGPPIATNGLPKPVSCLVCAKIDDIPGQRTMSADAFMGRRSHYG
jgi:hypothetical protein